MSGGRERIFTTVPARAISDPRLTALELRCLMVISLHDGMSNELGKGGGCYARTATLAERVGTDVTNFSKAVSRLLKLGYIEREQQLSDKRRYTLRVIFRADDSWSSDQQSAPPSMEDKVGQLTNDRGNLVGDATNHPSEIVGDGLDKNGGNSPFSDNHYIPLNGEIDFEETSELDSAEAAHFADREMRDDDHNNVIPFPSEGVLSESLDGLGRQPDCDAEPDRGAEPTDRDALRNLVQSAIEALGSAKQLSDLAGVSPPYVSRARYGKGIPARAAQQLRTWITTEMAASSLASRLPAGFYDLESTAQVPILERVLKQVDWEALPAQERAEIEGLLFSIADALADHPTGQQARRLYWNLSC